MPTYEPLTHPWQDALTRRLRTLVRTTPLHRVEASKRHRAEIYSEQDLCALALRALDIVIEKMGLGTGESMSELCEELRPLFQASGRDVNDDQTDAVAESIVLALLNETDRRQAFAEPYLQVGSDATARGDIDMSSEAGLHHTIPGDRRRPLHRRVFGRATRGDCGAACRTSLGTFHPGHTRRRTS